MDMLLERLYENATMDAHAIEAWLRAIEDNAVEAVNVIRYLRNLLQVTSRVKLSMQNKRECLLTFTQPCCSTTTTS